MADLVNLTINEEVVEVINIDGETVEITVLGAQGPPGAGVATPVNFAWGNATPQLLTTAPAVNVSDLLFRLYPKDSAFYTDETIVPCQPGATAIAAEVVGIPGVFYDLRVFSRNVANLPEKRDGAATQLLNQQAALNTTPPATPVLTSVTRGTGLLVAVTIMPNTESDLAVYEVWRGHTEIASDAVKIGEALASNAPIYKDAVFAAADLGIALYYFVKARNTSGTVSDFSVPLSLTVTKIDTADVQAGAISTAGSTGSSTNVNLPSTGAEVQIGAGVTITPNGGYVEVRASLSLNAAGNSGPTTIRLRKGSLSGTILRTWSKAGYNGALSISAIDQAPGSQSVAYLLTGRSGTGEGGTIEDHEMSVVNQKR